MQHVTVSVSSYSYQHWAVSPHSFIHSFTYLFINLLTHICQAESQVIPYVTVTSLNRTDFPATLPVPSPEESSTEIVATQTKFLSLSLSLSLHIYRELTR
jgi:hypothetical protein